MSNRYFLKFIAIVYSLLSAISCVIAILLFMPPDRPNIDEIIYILKILNIGISGSILVFSIIVGFMSCFCGKNVDTFCRGGCGCCNRGKEYTPFVTNSEALAYSANGYYQ